MAYTRHDAEVPMDALSRLNPDLLDQIDPDAIDEGTTLAVMFDYAPGTAPSGLTGPPENYDPGSPEEFYVVHPKHLPGDVDDAISEWLDANWERPDDGPDPDFERSRRLDDAALPSDWNGE